MAGRQKNIGDQRRSDITNLARLHLPKNNQIPFLQYEYM